MSIVTIFLAAVIGASTGNPLDIHPMQREQILNAFSHPPAVFGTGPLWVWNDRMTEEIVIRDLESLKQQGVLQVFVHPRPGLMTPYLSDEWFDLFAVTIREAEKRGMLVWIYDENSYPSGFAGGFVPAKNPDYSGQGLQMAQADVFDPNNAPKNLIAVFELKDSGAVNITDKAKQAQEPLKGQFAVFSTNRAGNSPWYGGYSYVDLMKPGVTESFLEITLEPYRKHFGDQFGKMILGSFTDEPHIRPAGGCPWTDDLPQRFQERWGYSLLDNLASLYLKTGDWKKVRHNYYYTILDQFNLHWGKPYSEFCEKNNLAFTGHYWEHDWPHNISVPDNMSLYQWHQVPAIDCLMNQYREDVHSQFGNARSVKELASVANQLGRNRKLCETYGAGGWDLRFEDMKRIGDFLYVLGVNLNNQHLTYSTLRGARKRDHPQSFSYHEPWWEAYNISADYFARLSLALSSGDQINKILLIEPTTTSWILQTPSFNDPALKELGDQFQSLVNLLEDEQIEYDIGSEDLIERYGASENNGLRVGQRLYSLVVIPEGMENINGKTLELLQSCGGKLILLGNEPPTLVYGSPSDAGKKLSQRNGKWLKMERGELARHLREETPDAPVFTRDQEHKGILFHQRRVCEDGRILFLVNTSLDGNSAGTFTIPGGKVEKLNLDSGKNENYFYTQEEGKIQCSFDLPPAGSLLLFISNEKRSPVCVEQKPRAAIAPIGPVSVLRAEPNVLTVDYCSVSAAGEKLEKSYFYQAQQFVFQKNGMPQNPWDSSVQFKDQLITKTFPPESGFTAEYAFTIDGQVPQNLWLVVERPDLYEIQCNGKTVKATPGAWHLDVQFGKIDIHAAAQTGANFITLKAQPMTIYHELESIYILGDFRLAAVDPGFAILPETALSLGAWSKQGMPFYASGVVYRENFPVEKKEGGYTVSLGKWYGSAAKVCVNGELAGYIGSQPWEIDVTSFIREGENRVEVTVFGTLKNTLGPHHNNQPLGSAWPGMFRNGPKGGQPNGSEYSVVEYGLFEPFKLMNAE
ncbi:MAG: glycosyl hydrolase [Candidatus Omnitrophota bacterium]